MRLMQGRIIAGELKTIQNNKLINSLFLLKGSNKKEQRAKRKFAK